MFEAHIYINRRNQLMKNVGQGLILLLGNRESSMNYADNVYPFRQDSTFLYYLGLDQPGLAAILDTQTGEVEIFGNDLTIDDIVWTGVLPTLQQRSEEVGVTKSSPTARLPEVLRQAQAAGQPVHYLPPYRSEHVIRLAELLAIAQASLSSQVSLPLIKAVVRQRNIKSEEEIVELEKAVTVTANMHLAAMRMARSGMLEAEVAAAVEHEAQKANCRLSFTTILTIRGETLHNHYHGNTLADGNLVLNDSGAMTASGYAGDMTRTFPVSARFTPRQRDLYEIVLKSQQQAIEALRPGIQFREVHLLASRALVTGLCELGLMKGDPAAAVAAGAHTMFFQCGLGHLMGLDVHDMENFGEQNVGYTDDMLKSTEFGLKSLRLGRNLEPGFVVTVEPGIYIIPHLIDMWQAERKHQDFIDYEVLAGYRDFGGIRIEDDLLITETGSRVLGSPVAKTVAEIEQVRQEELG